jgi:hypothetical protein
VVAAAAEVAAGSEVAAAAVVAAAAEVAAGSEVAAAAVVAAASEVVAAAVVAAAAEVAAASEVVVVAAAARVARAPGERAASAGAKSPKSAVVTAVGSLPCDARQLLRLTPRVRPFVQQTGIDIPDALVPSGEHLLRIDVKDSEGRTSTMSFLLKIAP